MSRLLVVDLLAEREAFGEHGVAEIAKHFPGYELFLWAPHTKEHRTYPFGIRVENVVEADVIVITGSRRNVSEWEPWMDAVEELIQNTEVPLYGICFGHQIICKALGGKVKRSRAKSHFMAEVTYNDGKKVNQLFTHQDHVTDSGELEVTASAEHCNIAACKHPTRKIITVQYHPEAVKEVLEQSLICGDMSQDERDDFGLGIQDFDVSQAFGLIN
ncbi:MAG: gamma-glutamyl-gamma-aminobutyrate hydrolase family protein [Candidatus Poseidoniaceae archaeon]|jgi:GMP synthase-like glutamine amidotransferase|nr:gamma-glutamyl-gamma-aminobutyrate hydrolase family protein [Candidatus Poseidoniaceae archaeon]